MPGTKSLIINRSKEVLRLYLQEIAQIPLLSTEEERELAWRVRNGDDEALERLVEANLRFVVKVAKRYRSFGVSFLDLINEGNLGLMEAAKRFDPTRNVKFISYAVWWIRQSILSALSNLGRPLKVPIKMNAALYKVNLKIANRRQEMQERPTAQELADDLGMKVKDVTSILGVGGEGISLNQPLTWNREGVLQDFLVQTSIPSVEDEVIKRSIKDSLHEILGELGSREQEILKLRYGFHDDNALTLQEIGDRIGLSRERVRQIEERALQKLRHDRRTFYLVNQYRSDTAQVS